MPRFYFDIRDGESLVADEVGLEFPTVNEARDERPLLRVQITFEVHSLADEPASR
jgi:hypothetical protein